MLKWQKSKSTKEEVGYTLEENGGGHVHGDDGHGYGHGCCGYGDGHGCWGYDRGCCGYGHGHGDENRGYDHDGGVLHHYGDLINHVRVCGDLIETYHCDDHGDVLDDYQHESKATKGGEHIEFISLFLFTC